MSGINCRLIVCILAVLMFKNRIDNYLVRAGYTCYLDFKMDTILPNPILWMRLWSNFSENVGARCSSYRIFSA